MSSYAFASAFLIMLYTSHSSVLHESPLHVSFAVSLHHICTSLLLTIVVCLFVCFYGQVPGCLVLPALPLILTISFSLIFQNSAFLVIPRACFSASSLVVSVPNSKAVAAACGEFLAVLCTSGQGDRRQGCCVLIVCAGLLPFSRLLLIQLMELLEQ